MAAEWQRGRSHVIGAPATWDRLYKLMNVALSFREKQPRQRAAPQAAFATTALPGADGRKPPNRPTAGRKAQT
jgi:hypothetical protein